MWCDLKRKVAKVGVLYWLMAGHGGLVFFGDCRGCELKETTGEGVTEDDVFGFWMDLQKSQEKERKEEKLFKAEPPPGGF